MSLGDEVRRKIPTVDLAVKNAGTENLIRAIVDTLEEIATALDALERRARAE